MVVPLRNNIHQIVGAADRIPGCTDACDEIRAIVGDVVVPTGIYRHDPIAHQEYGRFLAEGRIHAVVQGQTTIDTLVIDHDRGCVFVDDERANLTPTELGIVRYLASRLGKLCSPVDIVRAVFGAEYTVDIGRSAPYRAGTERHLLRTHFSRIRPKLGRYRALLVTQPSMGYVLLGRMPQESAS